MATAQTDVLTASRQGMEQRLAELKPLVDEYQRLEQAVAALDNIVPHAGNGTASTKQATTRVKAAASTPTKSASKARMDAATGSKGRGRPKGSGKRGVEVIAVVTQTPGLKVAQIAERMGLKPNYLYRVLPDLAAKGLVVKGADSGWFPVEADVTT